MCGRWVYVYKPAPGHQTTPNLSPTAWGFDLRKTPGPPLGAKGTVPVGQYVAESKLDRVSFSTRPQPPSLKPGDAVDIGGVIVIGPPAAVRAALVDEVAPLPASAFAMKMGESVGFDPARGVYALTAQTSGTPDPPRGLRAGTHFTVRNTNRARRILIDQRDPWGGIGGGLIRDGAGEPLPILVQFGLNFPEMNAEAKEPGWATLTYPLILAANETREIVGEHLYRALSDREIIYLNSLEDIGDPLLLQTTVGRGEAHTLTTGPYPTPLTPGNELRINDFRRIYSQEVVRSVSAILPTFFGYWGADGKYQGVHAGFIDFRQTSPFLAEYETPVSTLDGAVTGKLRVWQAAQSDMDRVFTEVTLKVNRDIPLDATRAAPLFFLRHHAFNPMAYMKYAITQADGSPREGDLTYAHTVVANGEPLGKLPFGCLYRASNALDQGKPCSDITGNPGFVLLEWDVQCGGKPVLPAVYAFCTGQDDPENGGYARDLGIVPTEKITLLPKGSTIHYRAVQMVWGNNSSDYRVMQQERERWAISPLRLTATVGAALSSDPPELRTVGGRAVAQLTGGTDWIPVKLRGMQPGKRLHVRQTDAAGTRDLGPGAPGEPWYNAWPDADGKCGFTFLAKMPADGGAVKLEISQ